MDTTIEVSEGPDAGRRVAVGAGLVIGRDPSSGLALADEQSSRSHARISASSSGLVIEDLGSTNGTFVNGAQVLAPTAIHPGDSILIGVSVLAVVGSKPQATSAVRPVPPALAAPLAPPDYLPAGLLRDVEADDRLDRLLDVNVKARARAAPLAIFALAVLVVVVWLAVR